MVKVEGIYRGFERVGQEVLLNERGFEVIIGNGRKEKFFERLDEEIDFSLFLHHVKWIRENRIGGYSFVNIKPSTLLRYREEITLAIDGKIVVEVREDHMSDEEIKELVKFRGNFPFLLSIDDFGRRSSNLDRIAFLKPNFVKVDMTLFRSPKEVIHFVSFLRNYSERSVLIAEKVESEEVFRAVKGAGIDLWQGWYEKKIKEVKNEAERSS